jgi:hypothetical protein
MDTAQSSFPDSKAARGKSYRYSIDRAKRLVRVAFFGELAGSDLTQYVDGLLKEFKRQFSEIVDLTAVDRINITPAEAIALADAVDPFDVNSRRAFVTCKESQTNAARMHQILRTPSGTLPSSIPSTKRKQWIFSETRTDLTSTPRKKTRFLRFPTRPAHPSR